MGCDRPENQPDPASFHPFDDLVLSIRQSGAVDHNGVTQSGFSSGANVTSSPLVSLPAAHPLPGNVNEMNNFQIANLKNLNTLHHHQLEPNLINVTNVAPNFPTPSETSYYLGNVADRYHSSMNNYIPTSGSFFSGDVLSTGIQNSGVSMNFIPTQSNVAACYPAVEMAGRVTGISQTSSQTSGSPFDKGYNMQNTKNIGGMGIHKDIKVNTAPFSSPLNIDRNFLTLGIGSKTDNRSKFRFSSKEVSSKLEEAVLPQINDSHVQQMKRNFSSLVHGDPGGVSNFQHDSSGLPVLGVPTFSSNIDEIMLAPGSRTSPTPFHHLNPPPDMRLKPSNSRNSGIIGKDDLKLFEPDPFKSAQGGVPPSVPFSSNPTPFLQLNPLPDMRVKFSNSRNSGTIGKDDLKLFEPDPFTPAQGGVPPSMPFSSNSTINPHLGYAKMVAAPQPAQPVCVAALPTIKQQGNRYLNISGNQSFTESPNVSRAGGTVRQDHLGQQSLVNVPLSRGNNPFIERMGSQIAGWSGFQPAPDNQFPKRLGVQLNDGAISQATREGVVTGTRGIQQIRKGNSYQSQDYGPAMHPTMLHPPLTMGLHPPLAMGRPPGGSPAQFNFIGLPYHAGQGFPISKVDATPQTSNIHGPTSVKRRATGAPPIAPTYQRRRTLVQQSNQQMAHPKQNIAPFPASSPSLSLQRVRWQGMEESAQPTGEKCRLCKRDVAFNPEGSLSRPAVPPAVAVLPCGHAFHDHCLQLITPEDQSKSPPCIPCALDET